MPHVTSPIWGVPPPYKRARTVSLRKKTCLIVSDTFSAMLVVKSVNLNYDLENDLRALSIGISDEIEVATNAIDDTMI